MYRSDISDDIQNRIGQNKAGCRTAPYCFYTLIEAEHIYAHNCACNPASYYCGNRLTHTQTMKTACLVQKATYAASPVSYTHLDVYKRQTAVCSRWIPRAIPLP